MTPTEIAALTQSILDTHHARLHRELPRLAVALAPESPRVRAPFAHLQRVMDDHMGKEEQILFPAIFQLCMGEGVDGCGVIGPIRQMQHEHDTIRTLESALREAARDAGPLQDDILELLDDLCEHARKEDEELFPAVLALVDTMRKSEADDAEGCGANTRADRPVSKPVRRILRETRGVCSECHADVAAAVVCRGAEVWLDKHCPKHGTTSQILSKNADYWGDLDRFYFSVNDESYPQRDFIVRMTEKCNLACPICLAKANTEDTPDLDLSGLEKLLSERRGIKIDLMAAEPTLRADLAEWVRKVKASGNIAALHTNGIKLADLAYARTLKDAGVDEVFLQFDGLDDSANKRLRGRPLLKARTAALRNLRELGIAVSLIVVIAKGVNEAQVGATFRYALLPENDHVREVFFLGLRMMGSARHAGTFADHALMPDEIIDLLCAQEAAIRRKDIYSFNLTYFAMLSAFKVKKCLYVQHYLVARDGTGGYTPVSDILDLRALAGAATHYAARRVKHPGVARAGLAAALLRQGLRPAALRMAGDLVRLETLFQTGMNLREVPPRFLLLGFITACDPLNFDAQVAINCGKGELSVDGGVAESSAVANVRREARFDQSKRAPGRAFVR